MRSLSIYYGGSWRRPFAEYTDRDLERDLASPSIDQGTAATIADELERRRKARLARKAARRLARTSGGDAP